MILAVCFVPNPNRKADRTESPTQQLEETIQHLLAGCTQAEGLRNLQPFGAIIIFGPIEVPRNELSRAVPSCAGKQDDYQPEDREKDHQNAESLA